MSINPDWREAIDKAMHESLMNKDAVAEMTPADQPPRTPTPPPPPSREAPQSNAPRKTLRHAPPPRKRGMPPFKFNPRDMEEPNDEDDDSIESPPPPRKKTSTKSTTKPRYEEEEEDDEVEEYDEDDPDQFDEDEYEYDDEEDDEEGSTPASVRSRIKENAKISEEEKIDMLVRLQQLIDDGQFKPVRIMTVQDRFDDIRYELFRAEREVARKRAIRSYQKNLVTASVGMEMAARHFGILNLNGFSKSILLSINDYTDTLDELHSIYKDSFRMRPEVRLVWQLGSSAYLYSLAGGNSAEVKVRSAAAASTSSAPAAPSPPQRTMSGPKHVPAASAVATGPGQDLAGLAMITQLLGR